MLKSHNWLRDETVHCNISLLMIVRVIATVLMIFSFKHISYHTVAEDDSDIPEALRELDFGDTMDEVENEVSSIQQRIQDLIETSLDDTESVSASPRSPRKRKMKTKEQSLISDEV